MSVFSRLSLEFRSRSERLSKFVADIIHERLPESARTPSARLLTGVLKFVSLFWGVAARTKNFLYSRRLLVVDTQLGCKVVVIGNITVGGTGKTPVTELLARVLSERGRKIAILSRGYKSRSDPLWRKFLRWLVKGEKPLPRVVSDGRQLLLGFEEAGDEPLMLARNLLPLGVVVIVNKNRVEAGEFAIRKFGCDTLLLDDGLQFRRLRGHINLLLIDKTNPFGNRCFMPRGPLRDPIAEVARGHYIFLTKSDGAPAPELLREINAHNPGAAVVECRHRLRHLRTLDATTMLPLDYLRGKRVATFSGIANPALFEEAIRQCGAQLLHSADFSDHHSFSEEELDFLFDDAREKNVEFVVTTEKDAVRINAARKWPLPVYYLRMEIEILSGEKVFEQAVERICEGLRAED